MSAAHRHPPAFQVEVGPQRGLQGLVALLASSSSACLVAALAMHVPVLGWLAIVLVPASAVLAWRLARVEPRHLHWDGQVWRLALAHETDPGPAVEVEAVIDFGDWLLLRTAMPGARLPQRHYLPLARSSVGATWGQLRATLYSARPDLAAVA